MASHKYYNSREQVQALLKGKDRRNVPSIRDTEVVRWTTGAISVRYNYTDVVVYNPDGTVTLNSGGWHTNTTKARMTDFSPFNVYQKNWNWFVALPGGDVPFKSGITLDPRTMSVVER